MFYLFRKNLLHDPFFGSFRRFGRVFDQMNRLLTHSNEGVIHSRADFPVLDVWSNEEGAVVTAEIPGVKTEDLDLSVLKDTLTIRGKRAEPELDEGERVLRQERFDGEFVRTVQLPYQVDPEKIDAEHRNGILTIRLERPETEKPRKITVKLGA